MKLLWVKASLLIIIGLMLGLISMGLLRSDPISSVSGLAVAQAPLIWNNVKDGAAGDNLINGLLASGLYGYDAVGGNWDRVRIDPLGNLNVNVAVGGTPTQALTTLLAAVAVPTVGATLDMTYLLSKHTWEIVVTGGPANETTNLEGSINGTTWYILDTSNTVTAEMRHVVNKPVRYVRGNCTVLPSGTVTVRYMGGGN
jgi:hypothetical protein